MQITIVSICRELKDTKQRLDSQSAEIRKKEGQLKEMQTKLEQGEGCKLLREVEQSVHFVIILIMFLFSSCSPRPTLISNVISRAFPQRVCWRWLVVVEHNSHTSSDCKSKCEINTCNLKTNKQKIFSLNSKHHQLQHRKSPYIKTTMATMSSRRAHRQRISSRIQRLKASRPFQQVNIHHKVNYSSHNSRRRRSRLRQHMPTPRPEAIRWKATTMAMLKIIAADTVSRARRAT